MTLRLPVRWFYATLIASAGLTTSAFAQYEPAVPEPIIPSPSLPVCPKGYAPAPPAVVAPPDAPVVRGGVEPQLFDREQVSEVCPAPRNAQPADTPSGDCPRPQITVRGREFLIRSVMWTVNPISAFYPLPACSVPGVAVTPVKCERIDAPHAAEQLEVMPTEQGQRAPSELRFFFETRQTPTEVKTFGTGCFQVGVGVNCERGFVGNIIVNERNFHLSERCPSLTPVAPCPVEKSVYLLLTPQFVNPAPPVPIANVCPCPLPVCGTENDPCAARVRMVFDKAAEALKHGHRGVACGYYESIRCLYPESKYAAEAERHLEEMATEASSDPIDKAGQTKALPMKNAAPLRLLIVQRNTPADCGDDGSGADKQELLRKASARFNEFYKSGQFADAEKAAREALRLDPQNAVFQAAVHIAANQIRVAAARRAEMLQTETNLGKILCGFEECFRLGQFEEARQLALAAQALAPDDPMVGLALNRVMAALLRQPRCTEPPHCTYIPMPGSGFTIPLPNVDPALVGDLQKLILQQPKPQNGGSEEAEPPMPSPKK